MARPASGVMGELAALAAVAATAAGCCRSPSPITPGIGGTVGAPAYGVLSEGVELPASGIGYRWLHAFGHHYGVPRVVAAIEAAAADVARERTGGAPLYVGDLSAKRGGEIPGHRSHRTGRDADLLFYASTPSGESIASPGFVKFGEDGLAYVSPEQGGPKYIRLDVAREWLLIKALLLSPDANVQWLFISTPLEALITEYAKARGEDPELTWHAEVVMQQPGDSLPHDDHLHLRTACSPAEALAGCEGGGPYWPWLPPLPGGPSPDDDGTLLQALLGPLVERELMAR